MVWTICLVLTPLLGVIIMLGLVVPLLPLERGQVMTGLAILWIGLWIVCIDEKLRAWLKAHPRWNSLSNTHLDTMDWCLGLGPAFVLMTFHHYESGRAFLKDTVVFLGILLCLIVLHRLWMRWRQK